MALRRILTAAIALTLSTLSVTNVHAQVPDRDYWRWFEVEVFLFKHTSEQTIREQFPLQVSAIPITRGNDLLTSYSNKSYRALRAGLDNCEPLSKQSVLDLRIDCQFDHEDVLIPIPGNPLAPPTQLQKLTETEVVVNGRGGDINTASQPFLMPDSVHELTETRQQLANKGLIKPLLHVAWRQPVFSEQDNKTIRLFAGKQFSEDFSYGGFAKQPLDNASVERRLEQDSLVEQVQTLLQKVDAEEFVFTKADSQAPRQLDDTGQLPELIWELDGLLHIFLIGNYLHIDSDFNLRETTTIESAVSDLKQQAQQALSGKSAEQPFLRAYPFKQRRRVISHETHYFDHPKMGMVIQIRRTDLSARRY
ncbi:MAG: CsiV family protein [Pseudomonadota bacterium]